jgi:hypothetical protein
MKLLVPVLSAIIVIGGGIVGMGYAGVIHIPGITPPKKVKPKPTEDTLVEQRESNDSNLQAVTPEEPAPQPEPSRQVEPPPPPVITQRSDGTVRLAALWSSMETEALVKLLEQWNDGDALQVLAKMDNKKLAEVLGALPPDKAARISMGIKSLEKGGK